MSGIIQGRFPDVAAISALFASVGILPTIALKSGFEFQFVAMAGLSSFVMLIYFIAKTLKSIPATIVAILVSFVISLIASFVCLVFFDSRGAFIPHFFASYISMTITMYLVFSVLDAKKH